MCSWMMCYINIMYLTLPIITSSYLLIRTSLVNHISAGDTFLMISPAYGNPAADFNY